MLFIQWFFFQIKYISDPNGNEVDVSNALSEGFDRIESSRGQPNASEEDDDLVPDNTPLYQNQMEDPDVVAEYDEWLSQFCWIVKIKSICKKNSRRNHFHCFQNFEFIRQEH